MKDQMTHAESANKLAELAEDNERLRTLISDLKAWDVEQYINIPHDLRARMQAELTPNAQVTGASPALMAKRPR